MIAVTVQPGSGRRGRGPQTAGAEPARFPHTRRSQTGDRPSTEESPEPHVIREHRRVRCDGDGHVRRPPATIGLTPVPRRRTRTGTGRGRAALDLRRRRCGRCSTGSPAPMRDDPVGRATDADPPRGWSSVRPCSGSWPCWPSPSGPRCPARRSSSRCPVSGSSACPAPTAASRWGVYFTLAAVYGGLLLFMRVWWGMTRLYSRCPGVPVNRMMWVFALWSLPMLVIAPLFSRDAYSYAAQGEMVSHHMNPYLYGPFELGQQLLHRPGRPAVGQRPGSLRPAVPPDRRLLRPDHLPQRAGHHRPAPAARPGRRPADRRAACPGWPASTTGTGPSSSR